MVDVSNEIKTESIKSLQSTIKKSEKALVQMNQKGSNTTLIEKRLMALCIGLAVLDKIWNQGSLHYTQDDLVETSIILTGLLPSIKDIYTKLKTGSSQRTLLERRIRALELAILAIDEITNRTDKGTGDRDLSVS